MKQLLLTLTITLFSTQIVAQINEPIVAEPEPTAIAPLFAENLSAEQKGLQIITEVDKRDTGFGDTKASMTMRLFNKHGNETSRSIKFKTLEVIGDGDKSLIIFNSPRDIKGTAFLSFTHALVPDEQWLYLPALKRVKRISSSNKSGPFLGSEYAFEDLTSFEVAKYSYRYIGDEVIDGKDCFLLELKPKYEYSGYTKERVWIEKNNYIALQIEYYDRKNSLLKTQKFKDYQQHLNQYWRANKQEIINHQNGKRTELIWENYEFGLGLTDRDFDKNTLKRAR